MSSLVSDNFVKRNLKRKFHGGNSTKRKYSSKRYQKESSTGDVQTQQDENHQSTLTSWGIDPLQLSLGKIKSMNSSDKLVVIDKRTISTPAPRGLLTSGLNETEDRNSATSRYTEEEIQYFHQYCPKCSGHQMPSRIYLVRKTGANKGRFFYSCSYPPDQRCRFFLWAEDNPDIINLNLFSSLSNDKRDYALGCYERKLQSMTKDQIVQEVKSFNQRINVNAGCKMGSESFFPSVNEMKSRKPLVISKRKEELIRTLLIEASWLLTQHENICSAIQGQILPEEKKDTSCSQSSIQPKEAMITLSDSEDEFEEDEQGNENVMIDLSSDEEEESEFNSAKVQIEMKDALRRMCLWYFGISEFRKGQSWAISRCLEGRKSLLVMPTGYGKSLCYILPSILLPGITLVISPLIALMNDQIMKLPPELPAVCLNSHLSTAETAKACMAVIQNQVKIIFISPERLCSTSFRNLIAQLHFKYGQDYVSLLCIDEAHCLSHWSYHFRPAFLRISREIDQIRPKSVLALTATASDLVCEDILQHLKIKSSCREKELGFMKINEVRDNLHLCALFCDSEERKRQRLTNILSSSLKKGANLSNIYVNAPLTIVYVWRRMDAEILSEYLKAIGIETVVYHGGLDQNRRELIQKQFDRGNTRCIIATVAFGMGIDKQDIRQVIHYSLPKSIENYLQEIGRAGRDGLSSSCALLYGSEETVLQYNYSFSTSISTLQIFCLFLKVFPYKSIDSNSSAFSTMALSLNIQVIRQQLDIPDSLLETILSLLELSPNQYVKLDRSHNDTVVGKFRFLREKYEKLMTSLESLEQSLIEDNNQISEEKCVSIKYQVLQLKIIKLIYESNDLRRTKRTEMNLPKFLSSSSSFDESEGDSDVLDEEDEVSNGDNENFSLFVDEISTACRETSQTIPSFIQNFRISKTFLSIQLNLSLDKVCDLLYQLQKNGLLEYQLKDSHFYVFTNNSRFPWSQPRTSRFPVKDYLNFIHDLAKQTKLRLQQIQTDATFAVVKMFKIAALIAKYNPITEENVQSGSKPPEAIHVNHSLHTFILAIANSNQPGHLGASASDFERDYHAACLPFSSFSSLSSKANFITEMKMMESDTILSQYFHYLYQYCLLEMGTEISGFQELLQSIFQQQKKQFITDYIMKMFFGFSSNFFLLNGMKGELSIYAEVWSKYRFYDYQVLLNLINESTV